ncbi:MAG: PAS domain-containing protein [Candidatus Latescibacteria bacterium]|nr:PAS domain-containing protein [Candidatus Latescibacterota bacterium]
MFKSRKLIWQLYRPYLLIMVMSLLLVALYASNFLKHLYLGQIADLLNEKALLFEKTLSRVDPDMSDVNANEVDKVCKEIGYLISTRFTVILPNGTVIGDSHEDPKKMDNHALRPEIQTAFDGIVGINTRFSKTLNTEYMYVALPVMKKGKVKAVIRTSMPTSDIDKTLNKIYYKIFLGGIVIAIISAFFSFAISSRINRPINEMKHGAARFANGDLDFRLDVPSSEEMDALADAMNNMAAQLNERIKTITSQRNELEAVLSSMVEAVVAVDSNECIIECNQAAESLFGIDFKKVRGGKIQDTINNAYLHHFISNIIKSGATIDSDNILQIGSGQFLQAHGTPLKDSDGDSIGALIVFNDVTRLKTLENIRRDFVANVSHELKTPITSIKGFVETLKDGAVNDPDNANRFLDIILKHADRLNAIIEDLLSLSRVEQETENEEITFSKIYVKDVLSNSLFMCQNKAEEKDIILSLECDDTIYVKGTSELLEQAVVNLIDNAIKYSDTGGRVNVEAKHKNKEVEIKIEDWGTGIPTEHLSRIFERFYRVDKARSRELGGTGLGLAIVKHIVQIHNGRTSVESIVGKGSRFYIYLPLV